MESGFTVLCINDKWQNKDARERHKPAPSFLDKDIVTGVTENEYGQYYHLAERFDPTSGFTADHFVVTDMLSEKEIMAPDEIANHLIDLHVRKEKESQKRFKETKKMLFGFGILGLLSTIFLFKK
jgi:hypothetical protein